MKLIVAATSLCRGGQISFQSTSDSDDEDEIIAQVCKAYFIKIPRTSIVNYFEEVVLAYSQEEFVRHFRLRRTLFDRLWKEYENTTEYKKMAKQNPRRVLRPDKTLAVFLWFAAHEACAYRDISDRFNISLNTVHFAILRIVIFISSLGPTYIKWPTLAEMEKEAAIRQNLSNIPGIIGEIYYIIL